MFADIIKVFTITFGYMYINSKLTHQIPKSIQEKQKFLFVLLALAITSVVLNYNHRELAYIVPLAFFWFLTSHYTYQPQKSFVTIALSFTISFGLYILFCITLALILTIFFTDILTFPFLLLSILSSILQNIAINFLCKTKRFRKGMPFLIKRNYINIATFISILLIFFTIYFAENNNIYSIRYIGLIVPIIAFIFLIYWWQAQITKSYRRSLELRELESLKTEVAEQNLLIQRLKEDNERMARITHRDNTLITTLKNSTCRYLATDFADEAEAIATRDQLIANINSLSEGRASLPADYNEKKARSFDTKLPLLDELLFHMDEEAIKKDITFSVHISDNMKEHIPQSISESDLVHTVDDLLKNAFKSTLKCDKRIVQLQFYQFGKHFVVEVADSGIPFEVETLVNMGLEKRTTYEDGSGIGLVDIWMTKEKYRATYHMDEYDIPAPFSKKISLTFDKKNRYSIRTWRADEILQMSQRADLQVYKHEE